jgi:hypothetical protein
MMARGETADVGSSAATGLALEIESSRAQERHLDRGRQGFFFTHSASQIRRSTRAPGPAFGKSAHFDRKARPSSLKSKGDLMAHLGNGLEHRWGERVRVNIPVHMSANALDGIDGCMKNLSLSGALMKSDCDLCLNTLIEVRIELPPPSPQVAVVMAHISRKFKEGIGIEWCEFAPTIVKDLLRSPTVRLPL